MIQFLKPTISKILFAAIIFVILYLLEGLCTPYHTDGPGGATWYYPCGFISKVMSTSFPSFWDFNSGPLPSIRLIVAYILSSTLLTLFSRFKK